MYSLILLFLVVVATIVALVNWRFALLFCLLVGALQDPIRKVTPGTPIYLTLVVFRVITSLLMIATTLEYIAVPYSRTLVRMVAYIGEAPRFTADGQAVALISGFYRSPGVMAWHAATLVIVSTYLLVRRPA